MRSHGRRALRPRSSGRGRTGVIQRLPRRRLLPFIVVLPALRPILFGSARSVGGVLSAVVASLVLVWLLRLMRRDHREMTAQVESRDSQLLTILDGLPVAVMLRAADGTLLHLNPGAERFVARLGLDASHVRESPSSMLDHVEVIDEDGRPYQPRPADLPVVTALREETNRDAVLGYALPGGGHAWYAIRVAPVVLGDGTIGAVVTCDDVTERHEAGLQVEVAERALRQTFDHAPIGIAVFALDGQLLQVNAALCELLGYDEAQLLAEGLESAAHPDERAGDWQEVVSVLSEIDDPPPVERRFLHSSGRWVFTQLSMAVVRSDDGTPMHLIAQVVDLSDRRALEQELRAAAVEDPLTGVANRRALAQRLTEAQQRRSREGGQIGLLYLDLDRFKAVNDTFGHDVGDRVLIATGQRLLAATREVDTVCRIGGDEFVVLCAPVDGPQGLQDLVDRLEAMPPLTVFVKGVQVVVAASLGSIMVESDEDLDRALGRADAAMYYAKRSGRATGAKV